MEETQSELMKKLAMRQKIDDTDEQNNDVKIEGAFEAPVVHINKGAKKQVQISPTNKENATAITALDLLTPKLNFKGSVHKPVSPTMSSANQNEVQSAVPPTPAKKTSSVTSTSTADSGASSELQQRLARQQAIGNGESVVRQMARGNIYMEFSEFSRKQIKHLQETFKKWDSGQNGHMVLEDLKRLMEFLGAPQTHVALKGLLKEVDEDQDGAVNVREFLLIFRKVAAGELTSIVDDGLQELAMLGSIDVTKEGVIGARDFFEAKIQHLNKSSAFEAEIRAEQDDRKKLEEEARQRKAAFKANLNSFQASQV